MKTLMTLCIVTQDSRILLGMKKRGFGAGRWNGFGGKVHEGESVETAARRELEEEVGLQAKEIEKVAVITFTHEMGREDVIECHVYHVTDFSGQPVESEEMEPDWFGYDEIPYGQMWVDDEQWLPYVLVGQKFTARFHMDKPATVEHSGVLLSHDIDVVEQLPSVPAQE
tara:strand:- start:17 stop:523 length:507 start_codon:yes stop_codon:yes gene_type:complete